MAQARLSPGAVTALLDPPPEAPPRPGRVQALALYKGRDLELIRLFMPAGSALPRHAVPGEITVQCLQGRIGLALDGGAVTLGPGELLLLAGDAPHDVTADVDSVALVTIALKAKAG